RRRPAAGVRVAGGRAARRRRCGRAQPAGERPAGRRRRGAARGPGGDAAAAGRPGGVRIGPHRAGAGQPLRPGGRAARRLRRPGKLGLRLIAPTVLGCAVPLDAALSRLREVGYFPVPEGGAAAGARAAPKGPAPAGSPGARPHALRRRPSEPVDVHGLAVELLGRGNTTAPAPESAVGRALARAAPQLGPAELDRLMTAVEDGGRVRIDYLSG